MYRKEEGECTELGGLLSFGLPNLNVVSLAGSGRGRYEIFHFLKIFPIYVGYLKISCCTQRFISSDEASIDQALTVNVEVDEKKAITFVAPSVHDNKKCWMIVALASKLQMIVVHRFERLAAEVMLGRETAVVEWLGTVGVESFHETVGAILTKFDKILYRYLVSVMILVAIELHRRF